MKEGLVRNNGTSSITFQYCCYLCKVLKICFHDLVPVPLMGVKTAIRLDKEVRPKGEMCNGNRRELATCRHDTLHPDFFAPFGSDALLSTYSSSGWCSCELNLAFMVYANLQTGPGSRA